jgi:hypothetical protein
LNAVSGGLIWSYTTSGNVFSSPAVADGKVFVGSYDNKLYCLNAVSGELIWSYTTGNYVTSSPVVVDGRVYVGSRDNSIYCFGLPYLRYFDGLFNFNDVQMVYPSEQTPKPLGCVAALVSDWLSSAFISTKLSSFNEGVDTDSNFVNQANGKPLGATSKSIISFGGPVVNPIVKYAESDSTPAADRAPLKFHADSGTFYFQQKDSSSIAGANLPASVINNNMDMFLIESYKDDDGRYILLCYGFGWKGTYAAGKYFEAEIYPHLSEYPFSWIIVKWEDTNANGFVNNAVDGDTYTIVASG